MAKDSKNTPVRDTGPESRGFSPLKAAKDAAKRDLAALISKGLADADTLPEKNVRSLLKFYIRECEKTYKARDAARAEVAELKERFVGEREVFTSEEVELITRVAEWGSTATHLVDAKALTRLQVAEYVTVENSYYHLTNKGRELQAEFKAAAVRASETALRSRLRFLLNELSKAPEERKAKAQAAIDTLIRNEV